MPEHRERAEHNAARRIADAFAAWHLEFRGMTRRARGRFARREWTGAQRDAAERLDAWLVRVERAVAELRDAAGMGPAAWSGVRRALAAQLTGAPDAELAGTFFNSVTRRLFGADGLDAGAEFTADTTIPSAPARRAVARAYPLPDFAPHRFVTLLGDRQLGAPWEDLDRDAALVSAAVAAQLAEAGSALGWEACDVLPAPFYRNKGAYVVGRLRGAAGARPLLLALVHGAGGVAVDAVLTDPDEASAVFGFTRSYFHVELEHPAAVVDFLAGLLPKKRRDELWTAIGYHKHGKTELYRELMHHLAQPGARFEPSEGDRGMVMAVFTLPSLNVVFKVIKDRFDPPKQTTHDAVRAKYDLVFAHDRVGRLADAQEFEHLVFEPRHFAPALLEELLATAARAVALERGRVVVRHCYTERRVTPLNLFLRSASPAEALGAVLDYGQAVRDLAAANIFPGDMLLKNFGVTRHRRVIFYDYDELCLLTECRFRRIPPPRDDDEAFGAEPWFSVADGDVFPEEFRHFMLLPGALGAAFEAAHDDLFGVEFWTAMQARQRAGEVIDFFPYPPGRRLPGRPPAGA